MRIRRADRDDMRRLCVTGMRAFHDDPVMRWLFPTDEEFFAPGGEVFRVPMTGWLGHKEVWCTDDGTAFAAWIPPGRPESTTEPDPPMDAAEADAAIEPPPDQLERFVALRENLAANTPAEDHWYLQLLATHPDWQRQGLGAALMAAMFERSDDEGLPCYLETETPENVAYYRRHGFEVRTEWDVPLDGPHMWGMFRPVN